MEENEQARTQVWLPIECKAEVEPHSLWHTPKPSSPLMTSDESNDAIPCISAIINHLFYNVRVCN